MTFKISDNGKFGRGPSWLVTCYMNGKRTRRSFETRSEAEQYVHEARAALMSGSDPEQLENALRLCAGTGFSIDYLVRVGLAHIAS